MNKLPHLLLIFLFAAITTAVSAEQNVAPGINDYYQNADPEQWKDVFERDGREIWDHREEILNALKLHPGMVVADVGAGTGFFSLMFAESVGPKGRVYAVDISPNFINAIHRRAKNSGYNNVIGVINNARSVMLPENAIDLIFISDTYHHFEYPHSTLASIHAALKPAGKLVIIDFKRIPGISNPWVISHVRADEAAVQHEIETAGFELIEQRDFMRGQYYLRFRKNR